MNNLWPRLLKSTYRKEPISSFILTVGAVDAVIGGVGDRWMLMTLGLGTIGVAIALRLWKFQQQQGQFSPPPVRYLPSRSSNRSLPSLTMHHHNPPSAGHSK